MSAAAPKEKKKFVPTPLDPQGGFCSLLNGEPWSGPQGNYSVESFGPLFNWHELPYILTATAVIVWQHLHARSRVARGAKFTVTAQEVARSANISRHAARRILVEIDKATLIVRDKEDPWLIEVHPENIATAPRRKRICRPHKVEVDREPEPLTGDVALTAAAVMGEPIAAFRQVPADLIIPPTPDWAPSGFDNPPVRDVSEAPRGGFDNPSTGGGFDNPRVPEAASNGFDNPRGEQQANTLRAESGAADLIIRVLNPDAIEHIATSFSARRISKSAPWYIEVREADSLCPGKAVCPFRSEGSSLARSEDHSIDKRYESSSSFSGVVEDEEDDRAFYKHLKSSYPANRFDEAGAKPAFEALGPKEKQKCIERLQVYRQSERWIRSLTENNGRFIPLASRFVREYENDPPPYIPPPERAQGRRLAGEDDLTELLRLAQEMGMEVQTNADLCRLSTPELTKLNDELIRRGDK